MLKCSECGKSIDEKEALVQGKGNDKRIICPDCFQTATGVDYKTFAYRKENAKMTIFAVLFCLIGTVYAFVERDPLYGLLGIVLPVLVYLFSSKAK